MQIQQIPLSQLKPSPKNVRRSQTSITALAASIAAEGLLQSLAVEQVNGHYEVVAGGRRLRALQQLVKDGKYPETYQVPCTVVEPHRAIGVSLAENAMRENMHPADQFEAFHRLLSPGIATIEEVAERFSVTVPFVRQRMKLAAVSPKILKAYRDGEIELKAVEAFALSDDHEEQERVFKDAGGDEYRIRNALTRKALALTDPRIKAIGGVEAYEKAGGQVLRDLFNSDPRAGYATDSKLVTKLLNAAFEKKAAKLREDGWSFVDVGAGLNAYTYDRSPDGSKADKTQFGAMVTLSYDGKIETHLGLKKRAVQKPGSMGSSKAAAKPGDLSEKEAEALKVSRDLRSALVIAQSPRTYGLAAMATMMCTGMFRGFGQFSGADAMLELNVYMGDDAELKADPAGMQLKKLEDQIRKAVPTSGSIFEWALKQPEDMLLQIIALGAARAVQLGGGYRQDNGPALAAALDIDPAAGWHVTADWLGKQPAPYVLEAVRDACGKKVADEVAREKGKAIAGRAAQLLDDAGWLPVPLRAHQAPKPKSAKKAAKA